MDQQQTSAAENFALAAANVNPELGHVPEIDLSAYYSGIDDPQIEADIAEYERRKSAFSRQYRGRIASLTGVEMLACLQEDDGMDALGAKIGSYFGILQSKNLPKYEAVAKNISERLTKIGERTIFFGLELADFSQARVAELIAQEPGLEMYRVPLGNIVKMKKHMLGEEAETLYTRLGPLLSFPQELFEMLDTETKFTMDGKECGVEEIVKIRAYDPDRETRKKAHDSFYRGLRETLGLRVRILNQISHANQIEDEVRNMPHPLASRNLSNNIPDEVIAAMNAAVNAAYGRVSHRYYDLKRQMLGLEKLTGYDRNAPLPLEEKEEKIHFSEAKEMVLDGYRAFSPRMADIAQMAFDSNWIDAAVTPGKRSGAFMSDMSVDHHPVMFMNYLGSSRDISTLAHELGHLAHARLAGQKLKSQGLTSGIPLTMAETASVFGERQVFEQVLARTTDPQKRVILLNEKINDMVNTVVRQNAFFNFEKQVHAARLSKKQDMTADEIGDIYLNTQKEALGPAFDLDRDYGIEWSYIPHFINSPYYVSAYAFGECLVNSLWRKYEEAENKEAFVQKYIELLEAGGSKSVMDAVKPFGLDLTDPGFWDGGMKPIEEMIDRLEAEWGALKPAQVPAARPVAAPTAP